MAPKPLLAVDWLKAVISRKERKIEGMQLTVEKLTKSFGEKQVLRDISFSCEGGHALGLLGRNGAGKTTTIRIIMDLFPPDSGSVLLDGAPIAGSGVQIGYLPEERGMYPKKIIMDQLTYFGALRGMGTQQAKRSAKQLLDRLEMGQYANKKLDTLSKGNQQKIQLAAALISNPDIVILDEPFSGLDPVNAMLLKDLVRELISQGKIVLFSSHQMNYIEEFCDDIAVIRDGEIVLSGNIRQIKRSYDRDKILITASNCTSIRQYLEREQGGIVRQIEKVQGDTGVLVHLRSAKDKQALLAGLAAQSLDFDSFQVYEPSLSDIFVDYTEDAKQPSDREKA